LRVIPRGRDLFGSFLHPGVAVLEKLVWLERYEGARESDYVLLPLQIDPDAHLEPLDESALPDDWDAFPHPEATRDLGTQWFEAERSAVLAVPSAPQEYSVVAI
jgi:hypothetical protein